MNITNNGETMTVHYANITNAKWDRFTGNRARYYDTYGYTVRDGVPCDYMIQVDNRSTWLRVKAICFSNSGSYVVKSRGETLFLREDPRDLIKIIKKNNLSA